MKYAWIKENRDSFPTAPMCRVMGVSRSGFYKWLTGRPSPRTLRKARIQQAVRKVHRRFKKIYGSYKIADELMKDDGLETACRNTVASAMQEMGLKSRVSKKFRPTTTVTDSSKTPAPNILNQDFNADAPNRKWATDITYLPTETGWVYLAVVLDLFSRKVVGWSISTSLKTEVVLEALRKAIELRRPQKGHLLHHSDRGTQYTSEIYQGTLKTLGMTCSMSRRGCCYDNAVVERFFWSLKHEWTKFESYADIEEARSSVFEYIEAFYNTTRSHQALQYQSPDEFEADFQLSLAV